jgi:hypothetical protein
VIFQLDPPGGFFYTPGSKKQVLIANSGMVRHQPIVVDGLDAKGFDESDFGPLSTSQWAKAQAIQPAPA